MLRKCRIARETNGGLLCQIHALNFIATLTKPFPMFFDRGDFGTFAEVEGDEGCGHWAESSCFFSSSLRYSSSTLLAENAAVGG